MGVMYQCPAAQSFRVYSCAGETCDAQSFNAGQANQRGPAPRQQVMQLLQLCHPQTTQEALAVTAAAAAGSNGIKVGDAVEVVTGFGWTPAKVVAIQGNSYRVLVNGIQVTKDYPGEVRRVGAATAQDNANGQYRLADRVQVNVAGAWTEGKITTEMGREYQVEIPGNRTVWAAGQNLRRSTAPPPAPPKAGVPPKPGMISCAGKIEGRYAATGGFGSPPFQVTFRSGKATMTDMGGAEEAFECWMAGDKMILHKPSQSNLDMPIDINLDGSLQTPLGEIKKKGN